MRDLAILLIHLIATVTKLFRAGGARSVVAESLLLKHQLLILNRSRERAPNLKPIDRVIAGLCTALLRPARLLRAAIVLKPSTIMGFHRALVKRKYRLLFTPKTTHTSISRISRQCPMSRCADQEKAIESRQTNNW